MRITMRELIGVFGQVILGCVQCQVPSDDCRMAILIDTPLGLANGSAKYLLQLVATRGGYC